MKAFRLMGVHQPESLYFALSSGERFVMHYRYLNLRGSILQEAGLHPSGGFFALGWRLFGRFG